jgi:hypothetical protein
MIRVCFIHPITQRNSQRRSRDHRRSLHRISRSLSRSESRVRVRSLRDSHDRRRRSDYKRGSETQRPFMLTQPEVHFGQFPLSSLLVFEHPSNEPLVIRKTVHTARVVEKHRISNSVKYSSAGEFFVFPIKTFHDSDLIKRELPDATGFTHALCQGWVDLESSLYKRELAAFLDNGDFPSIRVAVMNTMQVSDSDGELLD